MSRMAKDALGRRARRQFSEEFKDGAYELLFQLYPLRTSVELLDITRPSAPCPATHAPSSEGLRGPWLTVTSPMRWTRFRSRWS
jgi:hypothetical protein